MFSVVSRLIQFSKDYGRQRQAVEIGATTGAVDHFRETRISILTLNTSITSWLLLVEF